MLIVAHILVKSFITLWLKESLLITFPDMDELPLVRLRMVRERGTPISNIESGVGISCFMALDITMPIDDADIAVTL